MEERLQSNLQELDRLAETFFGKPSTAALVGFSGGAAPHVHSCKNLIISCYDSLSELNNKNLSFPVDILYLSGKYNWFDDIFCVVSKLRYGYVSFIYFQLYIGPQNYEIQQVERTLERLGFHLYTAEGPSYCRFRSATSQQQAIDARTFLAVNSRLSDRFLEKESQQPLLLDLVRRFSIEPRGVIHVGAHKGAEYSKYKDLGVSRVAFVEANPSLAAYLREEFSGNESVTVIEGAASNKSGTAVFKITNSEQSSSLLDLKGHKDIYPSIFEVDRIEVKTFCLDNISDEIGGDIGEFNLLALDIQGGEGDALKGAVQLLGQIDAIQVEVNYEELYEGCPLIWQLDEFLFSFGFDRVVTTTPYHPQWGDSLYIKKPLITNTHLGDRGRFGNQIFQYMFLLYYSMETGYAFFTPQWMGEKIFNVQANRLPENARLLYFDEREFIGTLDQMPMLEERVGNADFDGYFQYNMKFYRPLRKKILSEFSYTPEYAEISADLRAWFKSFDKPVIGVHMRRGDYGYKCFFIAPSVWYTLWIKKEFDVKDVVVYIASDSIDVVLGEFKGFNVIHAGLCPVSKKCSSDIVDFIALTQCDKLAISNSTFSFSAALLNGVADVFVRPKLSANGLVSFVPWESVPLLQDENAEDFGPDVRRKAKEGKFARSLRKRMKTLRKMLGRFS